MGVPGFPSIFKGIQYAVTNYPGSVISQSFGCAEQSFHAADLVQVTRFDEVYKQAAANDITVVSATGDWGVTNWNKKGIYPNAFWPGSDPSVTAVGGTWLQYGWTWNPSITADTFWSTMDYAHYLDYIISRRLSC
jgi:subtilase family serine protease